MDKWTEKEAKINVNFLKIEDKDVKSPYHKEKGRQIKDNEFFKVQSALA